MISNIHPEALDQKCLPITWMWWTTAFPEEKSHILERDFLYISVYVCRRGTTTSRPVISVHGSGGGHLSLDGRHTFLVSRVLRPFYTKAFTAKTLTHHFVPSLPNLSSNPIRA